MKNILIILIVAIISSNATAMDEVAKAHEILLNTIEIKGLLLSKFKVRESIAKTPNSGAYGEIRSVEADRLVRASTEVAAVIELHEHINDNGVMRMRKSPDGFVMNAGQTMEMKPGGYHLMLLDLKKPLRAGSTINLVLEFASGKTVELMIPVVSIKKIHH